MKRILTGMIVVLASMLWSLPSPVAAQQQYVVKPVAQKKIKQLPTGPLYWRVENFPTLADAKAAVGPDGWNPASVRYETTTALIAEVAGKIWVVTLGPKDASTPGGSKVAEIGPVPAITAPEYLLRLNYGSDRPGLRHRCIPIRAPKPSTWSPVGWVKGLRMVSIMSRPATR